MMLKTGPLTNLITSSFCKQNNDVIRLVCSFCKQNDEIGEDVIRLITDW
jgi:hypothetical protein